MVRHSHTRCASSGRIWCSHQCKSTFTDMQALINQTVKEGCIRLPSPFPPNLGISVTAGHHKTQPSHTKTIIPAARKLLHAFSDAYRELDMPDSPRVRLVGAFVQCTHPVWHWNTAYTIVLWVGVPAEGPVNLKVCPCFLSHDLTASQGVSLAFTYTMSYATAA